MYVYVCVSGVYVFVRVYVRVCVRVCMCVCVSVRACIGLKLSSTAKQLHEVNQKCI